MKRVLISIDELIKELEVYKGRQDKLNDQLIDMMITGAGSYQITKDFGFCSYGGSRSITNQLKKMFSKTEIDNIMVLYNKILYFNLLVLDFNSENSYYNNDSELFLTVCEDYLKSLTYKNFINYLKDPALIVSDYIQDFELMQSLYSEEMKSKSIKEIEQKLGIEFDVRSKINAWLRNANLRFDKENRCFMDLKTKQLYEFTY